MLDKLIYIQNNTLKNVPLSFKRYLYGQIDWNSKGICIAGARGTGKTTLLLQHFKEKYDDTENRRKSEKGQLLVYRTSI